MHTKCSAAERSPLDVVGQAEPWPLDIVCGGAAAGGAICSMCRGARTQDVVCLGQKKPPPEGGATICCVKGYLINI